MAETKRFKSIAGGNAAGITVLDNEGVMSTLDNYNANAAWRPSAPTTLKPCAISGDANLGVFALAADGSAIEYLTVVNNAMGKWKAVLPIKELITKVTGVSGNPSGTLVAFGGQAVATLDMKDADAKWIMAPALAVPFVPDLIGAAGDLAKTLYVVGNTANAGKVLKYPSPDNKWSLAMEIPFMISLMCGDPVTGFVFYGEGQLISVSDFSKPFIRLLSPPFLLKAICGNPKDGLVAIAGDGDFIVYCVDPSKPTWSIALGPLADLSGASK